MKTVFIYGLMNPITGEIGYIGKSTTPYKRLYRHVNDPVVNPKTNWIKSMIECGIKPVIIKIDEVLKSEWEFWEQYWISQFKAWGFNLKNQGNGGMVTKHTDEAKHRMRLLKIGKPGPWRGKKRDPETSKKANATKRLRGLIN